MTSYIVANAIGTPLSCADELTLWFWCAVNEASAVSALSSPDNKIPPGRPLPHPLGAAADDVYEQLMYDGGVCRVLETFALDVPGKVANVFLIPVGSVSCTAHM